MIKVNIKPLTVSATVIGLLLIGAMLATNHFGFAIRLSSYYFALVTLIAIYNLVSND